MLFKCRDKIICLDKTAVMGILNVTPDSFSDGGDHFSCESAVAHALKLEADGADIIDIGAQSTRPGHIPVKDDEEWARLGEVLKGIKGKLGAPVSVDTYYPFVAENALEAGVHIINDVSGVINPDMARLVAYYGCGWIIMHNGSGGVKEVGEFFKNAAEECKKYGIERSRLCFDPGIGFGKSYEQDMSLIANVDKYRLADYPLLLAASRKRVIGRASGEDEPKRRTLGNAAAYTAAILGGADIIRVHDVEREKHAVLTAWNLKKFVI